MTRRVVFAALLAAAAACAQTLERAEALWKAKNYESANTAFRTLVEKFPKNPDYKVRWGRLLLERFNPSEAADLFQEALEINKEHPGALYGMALAAADGFESKAVEFAQKALKADPKLVEAQELLARLALEDSNPKKAEEEAQKALKISPSALKAMAVLATIDWLDDKPGARKESPWIGKILEKDPRYGEAYELAADLFVLNRRYEEAIALYRKAIELKPDLWSAHSDLGINLMRLGQEKEAREQLELCYANGFRNKPTTNTLILMDSYKNFVTYKTDRTVLRLNKKEAELLRPYFQAELDRAIATYEKKYKVKIDAPVQVEVYPDHEDFAVRTMGMPGLGALGVTFGTVVAMDSPSGRRPGSFHWASTLWHELSHVYVLTATKHRVPRWFTEGMAVYEETAISPDWGDRLDPPTLTAIKEKKLLPVADLDRGFIRPSYPAQVVVSYFQAGRVCGYIARHWGYGKLLDMMNSFAESMPTAEVIQKHLGMRPEAFDKEFLAELENETKKTVDGFEEWRKKMKQLSELAKSTRYDEIIALATELRDLYPEYVESGSAYETLAKAYEAKNDKAKATAELERYSKIGGRSPETIKKLAALLEEAGRKKEAAAALERLNFVYLHDEELHRRLGDLLLAQRDTAGAVREFSSVVAMKPQDTATAQYNLARAWREAGKTDQAKDALLSALEAAPGFRPAQRMLLELSQGENKK
jgi:tetratricopeptide (TPR) repeat protein